MKWLNKGKELESKAEEIVKDFEEIEKIFVFGAGTLGEEIRTVLEKYELFGGYIDNSVDKQKNGCNGADVFSLLDYKEEKENSWIVVAASEENTCIICSQLNKVGLTERKDFFILQDFLSEIFPIISFYCYGKLFGELAQICLTERCTLKCKKCAHACFNVPNTAKDASLDFVMKSADSFFSKFDIVKEFVLIGGEPFLYKDLNKAITYIGENYREKMLVFSITTNGTILPDDETVRLCLEYDITLRISDYSESIPRLKRQYEKLQQKLCNNKVSIWKTGRQESWFDYGFEDFDRGSDINQLIEAFDKCKTPCREIRESKYYYCVMARSVAENMGLTIGENDYIDLNEITDRSVLLEFQMGFSDKGYLDMCRFCRGAEAKNYLIPAAEQKEGKV